ncbi:MAG: hypothetical protein HY000_18635 [Planctomycetes bacterium]|nr:hypothetical protein [Planctomycetota bacterium]
MFAVDTEVAIGGLQYNAEHGLNSLGLPARIRLMLQQLAVFNSDQVNAYGIKMPVGTLASALEQGWLLGQPLFLSHDRHRLEGWTRALGIHLEPGLARLTGLSCIPETEAEAEELKKLVYHFLRNRS